MTAPVWIRGILQDDYGVDPAGVEYFTGGEEEPGRDEKLKLDLPSRFKVRRIGPTQTLAQMLADGEVDAMHTARIPSTFTSRPDDCAAPFPRSVEVERDYYRRTRIFPDHAYHRAPARCLSRQPVDRAIVDQGLRRGQAPVYANLYTTSALTTMLPWQVAHVEEVRREMGEDWWPYGLAANQHVLDTFLRYHHEQGLSKRRLQPQELFAPETLESFKI